MVYSKKLIDALEKTMHALAELRSAIIEVGGTPVAPITSQPPVSQQAPAVERPKPVAIPQPTATPNATSLSEAYDTFESLQEALASDRWPEAVNSNLICDPNSETDKTERGRGIIELMVEEDLKDLKFLDFGCGEGHCASLATEYQPAISVGYDIVEHENWAKLTEARPGVLFTTDLEMVKENGPYDVIILFDVIDHLKNAEPSTILAEVYKLLANNGKLYMRTHPYCSRHATHNYHELNKAFVHLVFTPAELQNVLPKALSEPNAHVLYPVKTYRDWIDRAGFKIINRREITEKVEPFFKTPKIAERIMRNAKYSTFPDFQMSIQFIDYVLKKS